MKRRVRELTKRLLRIPAKLLLENLNRYLRGWAGYYARFPGCGTAFKDLDGWIRRRIRQWFWVQWKTTDKRRSELLKGGASVELALQACHIRAPWRVSTHRALGTCISNARIRRAGLVPLFDHYQRFAPS
jgi:RNA-directed DNA polymerase